MPGRWLQIKGDPSVRAFLFEQERTISRFDFSVDPLQKTVRIRLTHQGVFHVWIHYSSSHFTCRYARDPFCYEMFVREEVREPGFINRYPDSHILTVNL